MLWIRMATICSTRNALTFLFFQTQISYYSLTIVKDVLWCKKNTHIFLTSCRLFDYYRRAFKHQEGELPLVKFHYPIHFTQGVCKPQWHKFISIFSEEQQIKLSTFKFFPDSEKIHDLSRFIQCHPIYKFSRFPSWVAILRITLSEPVKILRTFLHKFLGIF